MESVDKLLGTAVSEIDRLLKAKNVLGDPVERDGTIVIPMVSYGFAFGAGGSEGGKTGGSAAGIAGGGGIKPIGAIIIDKRGARVESVRGVLSDAVDAIGGAAAQLVERLPAKEHAAKELAAKEIEK